ncbi:hypothetical protein MASR1M74_11700 [Lentimicrobium sp.]
MLFITFCLFVNGQTIYSTDREGAYEISYKPYGSNNLYNSKIINQLALANRKVPDKTHFQFLYNYNVSISYNIESQLEAKITLHPTLCTGDVFVYGFDLSKVLVPACCNISVRLLHPVQGEKWSATLKKVQLNALEEGVPVGAFPDSLWAEGSRAEVRIFQFEFSDETYSRAERELYLIRDYVAAATLADTLQNRLKSARLQIHSPESALHIMVFGAKSLLLLHEASAIRSIIIPGNDPLRLNEKLRANEFRYSDLLPYLQKNIILATLSGNLYNTAGSTYSRVLQDALALSQKTDYYSSPFFYRLYTNSITTGQLLSLKNQLDRFIDTRLKSTVNTGYLSRRVNHSLLSLANRFMAEERYAESVDILSSAVRMAKANPFVPPADTIIHRLAIARNGLAASYIKVVRKSINKKLSGLAENYLDEADRYSEKYKMTRFRLHDLPPLYEQLSELYTHKGEQLLSAGEYSRALQEFEQARRVADNHDGVTLSPSCRKGINEAVSMMFKQQAREVNRLISERRPVEADIKLNEALTFASGYSTFHPDLTLVDSMRKNIALLRYSSFVAAAESLNKYREMDSAMVKLLSANELAREFNLSHTASFDTLLTRLALPYINEMYSKGRLKLWAGQAEQALKIGQEANRLSLRLSIAHYSTFHQQYTELQQEAESFACSRSRGELQSLTNQIENLLTNNHFDAASQKITEARELIYTKSYCRLSTAELNQAIEPFVNRIKWNTLHREALHLIGTGLLNQGTEKLQQAEMIFKTYRLDTVGLANEGLLELALQAQSRELTDYTIGYLIARGRFDDAMLLLHKLFENKVPASETVQFQQSLARGLARRDKKELGEVPLKKMIKFYTAGDKWYKTFIDGYAYHVKSEL